MANWDKDGPRNRWALLYRRRSEFMADSARWLNELSGSLQREKVMHIGPDTSRLIAEILAARPDVASLQPVAREDRYDPAYDLAAHLDASKAALMAVTAEVKALFDAAGGKLHDMDVDVDGIVTMTPLSVGAAQTAALRNLIAQARAVLTP